MIPLAAIMMSGASVLTSPSVGQAQNVSSDDTDMRKAYWQGRYRELRQEIARARREVETQKTAYAEANRRNYRRGSVRHVYYEAWKKAEGELARAEEEFATIEDDARRDGALSSWFYEIEDEPIVLQPAVPPAGGDAAEESDEDAGRNPIFREKNKNE